MIRQGTVVQTEDGRLMAEVVRSEACAKCGQCAHAQQEKMRYALPKGQYRPGDPVEIDVPDKGALPAALLGYGMPLALMLIGLVIGFALGLAEIWQALAALAGLAVGYALLKILEPRLRNNPRFRTTARPCPKDER